MPLDATAAAAAAQVMADAWEANALAFSPLYPPPAMAINKASILATYTTLFNTMFASIIANAVVSPLGTPPLSNGGGAVGGTGKIL